MQVISVVHRAAVEIWDQNQIVDYLTDRVIPVDVVVAVVAIDRERFKAKRYLTGLSHIIATSIQRNTHKQLKQIIIYKTKL